MTPTGRQSNLLISILECSNGLGTINQIIKPSRFFSTKLRSKLSKNLLHFDFDNTQREHNTASLTGNDEGYDYV